MANKHKVHAEHLFDDQRWQMETVRGIFVDQKYIPKPGKYYMRHVTCRRCKSIMRKGERR